MTTIAMRKLNNDTFEKAEKFLRHVEQSPVEGFYYNALEAKGEVDDLHKVALSPYLSTKFYGGITTSIKFNAELFLVKLSGSIIENLRLRHDFGRYYYTDKYRFYERVKRSQQYNHNMSEQTLESEVAMRRVYGILLCAEDDEKIREYVYQKILCTDRHFNELVRNPKQADIDAFVGRTWSRRAKTQQETNAPAYFLAYLFYVRFGADTNNEAVKTYLMKIQDALWLENMTEDDFQNELLRSNGAAGVTIPMKLRSIIKEMS